MEGLSNTLYLKKMNGYNFMNKEKPRQIGPKTLTFEMMIRLGIYFGRVQFQHWTKANDLKSAVYEQLSSLEFDADHEAMYGMERYYTVQQSEEPRDTYKIGRKLCRKFLRVVYCRWCLVHRFTEIGLQYFLHTIKNRSDLDTSSSD
ncbi:hypothetical protein FQA39_LY11570 [Lamprigera yunnana]|nr:hypothetical protein FQA39_LY11570 [Lamprigera yunnana]